MLNYLPYSPLAGAIFPDWGYSVDLVHDGDIYESYAEYAHWPQFVTAYLNYIRRTYSPPYTDQAKKNIAFLLGIISHQVADPPFHSGLLERAYLIDNHPNYMFLGEHSTVELGVDVFNLFDRGCWNQNSLIGCRYKWDAIDWFLPKDAVMAAYAELYANGVTVYSLTDESWLLNGWTTFRDRSTALVNTATQEYLTFSAIMSRTHTEYYGYAVGGMTNMADLTANRWTETWKFFNYTGPYYVKPTASGSGDCQSWENACTLPTALGIPYGSNELWVMAGTYKPTTGTDRAATFSLQYGLSVYGGFAGTETSRDQRDPIANLTILSGDIDNNDSQTPIITDLSTVTGNATNSYHVVTGASNSTLDGFIVTAGYANGSNAINGGGMINYSSPTITNVTFSGNFASGAGGGMYNDHSNPILTDITFQNNRASYGGGMENFVSSPVLVNTTLINNTATNGNGGGMRNASQTICNPYGLGSNCHIDIGSPTLTNVTFSGNTAKFGGGIDNDISSPTLTNVTFNGNTATALNGGGSMHNKSQYTCMSWIFSACTGHSWHVSAPIVQNSILWGSSGGEISNESPGDPPSKPQISNSVVQGGCPAGTTCSNIIASDPKLGTLGDYGGYTPTIPLLWGSSAIDVGDDTACPDTDQRGVARPQGNHCDIGATEMLLSEIDTIPPSITGVATTSPNDNGWYNTDVTVRFTAEDAQSGLASVTRDQTLTAESAGQNVTGTAVDLAGNTATFTVGPINIDKTPPAISGETTALPNENGWYNTDVIIHFTAEDLLSGLDTLTSDQTLAGESAGQSVTGTATDLAGNSASVTVGPIKIDKTPPVVTVSVDKDRYTKTEPFTVHFNGSDALSGVSSLTAEFNGQSVTDWQVVDLFWLPLGTYTLTARAEDLAGNVTEASQSIEISATLESLNETVARLCTEGYITKEGTCNELSAKLDAAIAAQNRGNDKTAANLLRAFQNVVNAQTDKSIQGPAAQLLLLDSEYMKDKLSR